MKIINKIKKTFYGFLATAMAFSPTISLCNITYATDRQGSFEIEATYDPEITPTEGDLFLISYATADGSASSTIELDTYLVAYEPMKVQLPIGQYFITNIEYQGTNETIKKEGYVASSTFAAETTTILSSIQIAIGNESVQSFFNRYGESAVSNANNPNNMFDYIEDPKAEEIVKPLEGDKGEVEDPNTENQKTEDLETQNPTVQKNEGESHTIIYNEDDTDKEKSEKSSISQIVIVVAIVISLFALLILGFFIYKKKLDNQ